MAKNRKMTEDEVSQHLQEINVEIGQHLNAIKAVLPKGYLLTLVCRNVDVPQAQMIFSDDTDFEEVSKSLLDNKTKVVEG